MFGDNINTINKNTQTIIDSSNELGLEVNKQKGKHVV
jgi:hypothetical protein